MKQETVIQLDSVSKKFCRSLKRSMWYGALDIVRDGLCVRPNLGKLRKKEFWAVQDTSFELKRGEVLGIIGPNGAGKTTILKMLNGIILPDMGSITVRGRVGALIAVGAGFHPQLTGRENVYINGAILGMSKREIDRKFKMIVDFSEIGDFLDTPVKHYSSGMFIRLGFSVAVHCDPDILLIDEVLSVGDIGFRAKCIERVRNLINKGTSVIFISHNMDAVIGLCDRTMVMDGGRVKYIGESKDAVVSFKEIMNNHRAAQHKAALKKHKSLPDEKRKVEIVHVGFFDEGNNNKSVFETGQEMVVRITFRALQEIEEPVFGVGIWRSDGLYVTGLNTYLDEYLIERIDGYGMIELRLKELNLLDGEYLVTVGVLSKGSLGFYVLEKNKYRFFVHSVNNEQGAVYIEHEWNFPAEDNSESDIKDTGRPSSKKKYEELEYES